MEEDNNKKTYVQDNTFFINGTFNDDMRQAVVPAMEKRIRALANQKGAMMVFFISSHGGDGYLALDIIRLMELAKKADIIVRTIVTSHAFSAGSMVAIAGTEGERYIAEGAEHLPHYGSFGGYRKHTPLQLERHHDFEKRWTSGMIAHYKKYSNIPKIEKHLEDDGFFIPADKAVKWGLADHYFEEME